MPRVRKLPQDLCGRAHWGSGDRYLGERGHGVGAKPRLSIVVAFPQLVVDKALHDLGLAVDVVDRDALNHDVFPYLNGRVEYLVAYDADAIYTGREIGGTNR